MAKVYWEVSVYKLTDAGYTQDTDLQSVIAKVDTAIVNAPADGTVKTMSSQIQTIKDNYFTGVTFVDTAKAAILEDCMDEIITNGIDYDIENAPEDPYAVAFGS